MWMVGYNDHGAEFSNMADHPFNGRKLRPLIPRPLTSPNNITSATPSLGSVHQASDFFSQYHNLASVGEHSKKEYNNSAPVVVSSRWNPTPEQLRALEELYRRGIRTPSAEQIQHITAQLRRFGKIEGKNVFYWFQNHKARERQKRRRQMESAADHTLEKKDLDASRTVFEVEQTKNWPSSTSCSTPTQESVSVQRTAKAAVSESRTDGWIQFDEGELQEGRNFMERNGTWQMMQISCPPPAVAANSTHPINTAPTTTKVTSTSAVDPKLIKTSHDLSLFISPHTHRDNGFIHLSSINSEEDDCVQSQTLELFPLRSSEDGSDDSIVQKETQISVSAMNANLTPSQFFEFLPLKN